MIIQQRKLQLVNTDPQRRCYNGCNYSEAWLWSAWEDLQEVTAENCEDRLSFWRELNDYAVSQRGKSARKEFRIVED